MRRAWPSLRIKQQKSRRKGEVPSGSRASAEDRVAGERLERGSGSPAVLGEKLLPSKAEGFPRVVPIEVL